MSRIGKQPVQIPEGVTVDISGREVTVSGKRGSLTFKLPRGVEVKFENNEIVVGTKGTSQNLRELHGTVRAIIANNVHGVADGWSKVLELVGTGYRAEVLGSTLSLSVGFSQPVKIETPEGVSIQVAKNLITVEGSDKELIGQVAATIRAVRPPEPYKGKGIKYQNEVIRRKAGKAAKAQGALG